jgi:hypothetical protein
MRMTGLSCPGTAPEVWLGVPILVRQEVLWVMAVSAFRQPDAVFQDKNGP